MARRLLDDRSELEALFDELADELHRLGASADVVMVGGSWILWHSQRASTRDVPGEGVEPPRPSRGRRV
jgi:hypothetical protein